MKQLEIIQSWDDETIEYDKSLNRQDGIYPDTVLWGIAVNGCCNPSVLTFLQEVAKVVNELAEKED